jgi:hypothetical protein
MSGPPDQSRVHDDQAAPGLPERLNPGVTARANRGMREVARAAATDPRHAPDRASALKLAQDNERDLARVISTEARGTGEAAMRAVGWTLRNRMIRNQEARVDAAWHGYQHGAHVTDAATQIARGILAGTIPDPTNGATHFYSPSTMPKEGQPTRGMNVAGDLESVPGVVDAKGQPVKNYRPDWAAQFPPRPVADVPESVFKFYYDNQHRRVR